MAEKDKTILAVDDTHSTLQIVHSLLKDSFNMHLAKSGKMALNVLEHLTPDLILLDIEMPDMSGFDMMNIINGNIRLRKIPVIFITSHSSKDFVITAGRQGAKDYLVKPFDPELLKAKIQNALKYSQTTDGRKQAGHNPMLVYDEYDLENDIKFVYQNNLKKTSGVHMKIIGDLFGLYESEYGKPGLIPTYFDVYAFFNGICSAIRPAAESKGLIFQSEFGLDLPHIIFGDEIRVNQILINILNDIIQYSAQDSVRFAAKLITDDKNEESVAFSAECGILNKIDNDFEQIYENFSRLNLNKKKKLGIQEARHKLPIAKQFAELIDGEIYFSFTLDKSSAFIVELPLQTDEKGENSKNNSAKPAMVKSEAYILIVDDNPVNLKIAAAMLSKHGVTPKTAQSGEEAVRLIQETRFDLIFMDHLMPGMDGAETAKTIRALGGDGYYAEVPIIALSAYNASKAREMFLRSGMNDFIAKPIDDTELNMVLRNWLPSEKLIEDGPNEGQGEAEDDAEINELLNRVSAAGSQELSITKGLRAVGGNKRLYVEVLSHFCNWIENDMRLLNEALQHKRCKDYTVRMHALRAVFANLGDELMSGWAASLEKAANEGDMEKCVRETEYFNNNVTKLHTRLRGVFKAPPVEITEIRNDMPQEKIKEILLKLSEACLTSCADKASGLAAELNEASLGGPMDGTIK